MTINTTPANHFPGAEAIDHTEHIFRLLNVLNTIKTNPERWNQRVWVDTSEGRYPSSSNPVTANTCGTAFCFAGWAVANAGFEFVSEHYVRPIGSTAAVCSDESDSVRATASRLLGITDHDATYLFDERRTLEELEAGVFALVLRHTAEMNPDTSLRYDEDGRVYVGYYVEPFAFIWDGLSKRVQVCAGGMGEPITDTFDLPFTPSGYSVFKDQCDNYARALGERERERQARTNNDSPDFNDLLG